VDYYFPSGTISAEPYFVSPNGSIMVIHTTLPGVVDNYVIRDGSNPTEAAKGYQDVGDWLESHLYISNADRTGRTLFNISGMSDDESTLVGEFSTTSGTVKAFRAHRLVAMPQSPLTLGVGTP